MPRLRRDVAAAIGFITAVVALGKLIYEGWPWLGDALPWLGAMFFAFGWLGAIYLLIRRKVPREPDYLWVPALVLIIPALPLLPGIRDDLRGSLAIAGVFGLILGAVLGGLEYADRLRKRPLLMPCPHCLEDVKGEASVCRHCGRTLRDAAEGGGRNTRSRLS
jgi:hypothetical protein